MPHLKFARCIKRNEGTNSTFVEVTEDNVEEIRTLWKQPKAEVGQIYLRFGVVAATRSKLLDKDSFERYYRIPQ